MNVGGSADHFGDVLDLSSVSEIFMEDGNDWLMLVTDPIDGLDVPAFFVESCASACVPAADPKRDGARAHLLWR